MQCKIRPGQIHSDHILLGFQSPSVFYIHVYRELSRPALKEDPFYFYTPEIIIILLSSQGVTHKIKGGKIKGGPEEERGEGGNNVSVLFK